MKDQSKQAQAPAAGTLNSGPTTYSAQPSIGGPGQGGMSATQPGQGQSFNASGGSLPFTNSVAGNDALTIPSAAPAGDDGLTIPTAPAGSTGPQGQQAPPGYYYSPDGTLLLGGASQTAPAGTVNPHAPGGGQAPAAAAAPAGAGMPDFGPLAGGLPASGPIANTIPGAGSVQSTLAPAGAIQNKLDLSSLGSYATSAGYGTIQDRLDNSNVPALAGGDALGTQMTQAQQSAYKNATGYLDPQWQNAQNDLETKLANQGVMQNSEAWNKAMQDFNRSKTFAYDQAYTGAYDKGLTAQNQLFGQGLAVNQNQFGQNLASGEFANSAQAQGFGQSLANAQLQNQARTAQGNEAIAGMSLANQAQAQGFGQNLAAGQFGNAAQAQTYGQNANNAAFGNAAQAQQFGQGLASGQFANSQQAQLADQWLRNQGLLTSTTNTQIGADAQRDAAQASAGASTTNMQAQLAAQAAQNQFTNSLAARNQGLTEQQLEQQNLWQLLGLMNGGNTAQGATTPNFTGTPQTNVGNTDIASAINNQYNGNLNTYNANVGQQNSNTNAMATIIAAYLSDRRLKTNVRQIGVHSRVPVPVYEYDYLWGEHAIGVMADELEEVMPEAVFTLPNGFKAVDYARL